jgi:phosphopantetheine--protein transferase-like protein
VHPRRLAEGTPQQAAEKAHDIPALLHGDLERRYERLAARFAVKEAVIKALDAKRLPLRDIEVENTASGRPEVRVKGMPGLRLLVSITHTSTAAFAAVIAFK